MNNWDTFQHYTDRAPIWIKNYTALLSNPDYVSLTWAQRGLLHGLWIAYANSHRTLPQDTSKLSSILGERVRNDQLEALNHAGFLHFSASKPLAQIKRRVEKTPKPPQGGKSQSPSANGRGDAEELVDPRPFKCPQCGVGLKSERGLNDHLYNLHDVKASAKGA
jgi:hypothetical protein